MTDTSPCLSIAREKGSNSGGRANCHYSTHLFCFFYYWAPGRLRETSMPLG